MTLHQGSKTEMTFSSAGRGMNRSRGATSTLKAGIRFVRDAHGTKVRCCLFHLTPPEVKLCLCLEGKAISTKNYKDDTANLLHNTQAPLKNR